jgi:hypothetical protein
MYPWEKSPALQTQYEDDLLTLKKIRTSEIPTRIRVTILTELSKLEVQCSVTKYKRNVVQDYLNLWVEAANSSEMLTAATKQYGVT